MIASVSISTSDTESCIAWNPWLLAVASLFCHKQIRNADTLTTGVDCSRQAITCSQGYSPCEGIDWEGENRKRRKTARKRKRWKRRKKTWKKSRAFPTSNKICSSFQLIMEQIGWIMKNGISKMFLLKRLEAFCLRLSSDSVSSKKKGGVSCDDHSLSIKKVFEASKFCLNTTSKNSAKTIICLSVLKCLNTWSNYHLEQGKTFLRKTQETGHPFRLKLQA